MRESRAACSFLEARVHVRRDADAGTPQLTSLILWPSAERRGGWEQGATGWAWQPLRKSASTAGAAPERGANYIQEVFVEPDVKIQVSDLIVPFFNLHLTFLIFHSTRCGSCPVTPTGQSLTKMAPWEGGLNPPVNARVLIDTVSASWLIVVSGEVTVDTARLRPYSRQSSFPQQSVTLWLNFTPFGSLIEHCTPCRAKNPRLSHPCQAQVFGLPLCRGTRLFNRACADTGAHAIVWYFRWVGWNGYGNGRTLFRSGVRATQQSKRNATGTT